LLSSGQEFDEKILDSKHVLKVYFKPSRKKKYFVFLPLPILPVRLKILHLNIRYFFPLNKNCVNSRFFHLIASYGVLEEFASVVRPTLGSFYYLPILTTTK
jgi:hypothetical protein